MTERVRTRQVRLVERPTGWPVPGNFELTGDWLEPGPEDVVVRNLFLSVDPYMRGRMNAGRSYVPAFEVGEVMEGSAVGEVVRAPSGSGLAAGDLVGHMLGWREVATGPPAHFHRLDRVPGVSPSAYLGALGLPGLTAYAGLLDVGRLAPGETVFVSAAAGAVGSMVGQLARLHGAGFVVGSAGTAAKVEHLTGRLGFDRAFNYRDGAAADLLRAALEGHGLDIYFDNVGDELLDAALRLMRPRGRVVMCGAISRYNGGEGAPIRNLALAVGKRIRLEGFLVGDYEQHRPAFTSEVGSALARGDLTADETVVDGIENMVDAFLGMLRGTNLGKMVVRVGS